MSLHTIILAAGRSSRFGNTPKQLAVVAGKTLLERSITLAKTLGDVSVVLGYEHDRLKPLVKNAEVLVNPDWQEGIGRSIAFGVSALPSSASAVLILLCDQAAITEEALHKLYKCYNNALENAEVAPIVCASYANGFGVPAIFPRYYFSQLIVLTGDVGAKKILLNNSVVSVPMEDAAIDIDTQENWIQFTQAYQNK